MYILSKAIYFLINPIIWVFAIFLVAFFRKKEQRKWLRIGIVLFLFFSLAPIFQVFARMWEVPMTDMRTIEKEYDIGIVLGGFSRDNLKPYDRLHFTTSSTRLTTAMELYQSGVIKKIMVTGGSFAVPEGQLPEGERCRIFLEKLGIPKEDIIIESESLNTRENAILSKKIIDNQFKDSSCLLITSAWHMRRANACFKKANFHCDTFSTDTFNGRLNRAVYYYIFPNGATLSSWQILTKEWFGFVMYKVMGYV